MHPAEQRQVATRRTEVTRAIYSSNRTCQTVCVDPVEGARCRRDAYTFILSHAGVYSSRDGEVSGVLSIYLVVCKTLGCDTGNGAIRTRC